jgi:hypothetical protein
MVRHALTTVTVLALAVAPALAQSVPEVKLPASPAGTAAIELGGTWTTSPDGGRRYENGKWLTVEYSRPILRGRSNIFGAGADYGKTVKGTDALWRAGANATTRLTTQATLDVGGTTVPPGVYSVLVDLDNGAWTLVLSNQPTQAQFTPDDKTNLYGATNYDPKFDVARMPMTVTTIEPRIEQFTIGFIDAGPDTVSLAMWWDRTMAVARLGVR